MLLAWVWTSALSLVASASGERSVRDPRVDPARPPGRQSVDELLRVDLLLLGDLGERQAVVAERLDLGLGQAEHGGTVSRARVGGVGGDGVGSAAATVAAKTRLARPAPAIPSSCFLIWCLLFAACWLPRLERQLVM